MARYLIDTSVLSDYFSASLTEKALDFLDGIIDQVPVISVITQIELLCWNASDVIHQKVRAFIADSNVLGITNSVIESCVDLRKKKKVKTPDAIIAATALTNGLVLLTSNTKDFQNIPGLVIIDPRLL